MGMPWTDERIEQLRKLCGEGLSASQMAAELGNGLSRNAVIGKIHRMGITWARVTPANRPKQVREPRVRRIPSPHGNSGPQRASKSVMEPAPFIPSIDTVAPLNLDLQQLTSDSCRWPYGDGPFTFCGHQAAPDCPYCPSHRALAYTSPKERKDRIHHKMPDFSSAKGQPVRFAA